MTMTDPPLPYWGNILKSNSNGTYFGVSVEHVNRDERGYVDFEKMIGLDGIALINVVSNTDEAIVSKRKTLQTRITHNDGKWPIWILALRSYVFQAGLGNHLVHQMWIPKGVNINAMAP